MPTRRIPTIRGSEIEKDEALYDGIRQWMRNPVRNWLEKELTRSNGRGSTSYAGSAISAIELSGRIDIGALKHDSWRYDALVKLLESNADYGLDIIQAYVETADITDGYEITSHRIEPSSVVSLNAILVKGGSKWHIVVSGRKAIIQARVDETTENAYKKLAASAEDYANLLKKAWSYCYGREPQPSEAYTYAVKAVEAVSWQMVTPKHSTATLGTIIADLEAKNKSGKVTTLFKDKHAGASVEMILQNMKRLWQGHSDRHATGAYIEPTQLEAEVSLHLAITLCHLFTNNTISVS